MSPFYVRAVQSHAPNILPSIESCLTNHSLLHHQDLDHICVEKGYRGKGIGEALILDMIRNAIVHNIKIITILTVNGWEKIFNKYQDRVPGLIKRLDDLKFKDTEGTIGSNPVYTVYGTQDVADPGKMLNDIDKWMGELKKENEIYDPLDTWYKKGLVPVDIGGSSWQKQTKES